MTPCTWLQPWLATAHSSPPTTAWRTRWRTALWVSTWGRCRPTPRSDLVIRPGPTVGQRVHRYLRRRAGREPVDYVHPDLAPVLARTLGLPLFPEQLPRVAMIVAGFTGGHAEELRQPSASSARRRSSRRSVRRLPALSSSVSPRLSGGQLREDRRHTSAWALRWGVAIGSSYRSNTAVCGCATPYWRSTTVGRGGIG